MRMLKGFFVFGLLLTTLTRCATLPAPQTPQNEKLSWDSRAQTLSNIQHWDLKAQMAIRTQKEAESVSLRWQQNKQNYAIDLFGPLGAQSYLLTGSPNHVVMTQPNGKKISATSAEALLIQQTGWNLPVSYLKYWVRGIPVPGLPAVKQYDSFHHLTELSQAGWRIQFLRYTAADHLDLPSKIFLHRPEITVKMIISEWQLH